MRLLAQGVGGLSPQFIEGVHREVDAHRWSRGMAAWKWRTKVRFKERQCAYGCGEWFVPTGARSKYLAGHKPATARPAQVMREERVAAASPRQNPKLDYRLALAMAQKELTQLTQELDDADNEMEGFRAAIVSIQMVKDAKVERHGIVAMSIDALKLLAEEYGPAGGDA